MGSKTCIRIQLVMVWWPGREGTPLIQGHWVHDHILLYFEAIIPSMLVVPNLMQAATAQGLGCPGSTVHATSQGGRMINEGLKRSSNIWGMPDQGIIVQLMLNARC